MILQRYFGLEDKRVLITGATGGIGTAMAQACAEAGARLVLASQDAEACAALAASLPRAQAFTCDVARASELEALASFAEAELGGVDALLCNAGVSGAPGPMGSILEADRDHLLAVNLLHPMTLGARLAPVMARDGGGSIVLTASLAGLRGNKALGLYGVTKAGLIQLARNLAVEYGPQNIRANAIAPGLINTSWADAILNAPAAAERRLSLTPLRRIGEPWEVAAAALFLAGPGAAFITGQTLVIDGGTLITDGN